MVDCYNSTNMFIRQRFETAVIFLWRNIESGENDAYDGRHRAGEVVAEKRATTEGPLAGRAKKCKTSTKPVETQRISIKICLGFSFGVSPPGHSQGIFGQSSPMTPIF